MVKTTPNTPPHTATEAHAGSRRKVEDDESSTSGRVAKKARTRVRYVYHRYLALGYGGTSRFVWIGWTSAHWDRSGEYHPVASYTFVISDSSDIFALDGCLGCGARRVFPHTESTRRLTVSRVSASSSQ